jgi:hypothetical protein
MKPKIPAPLLETLRSSGEPAPWKCKLHLRGGRIIYGAEINGDGEITRIGDRVIYSAGDIGFGPGH